MAAATDTPTRQSAEFGPTRPEKACSPHYARSTAQNPPLQEGSSARCPRVSGACLTPPTAVPQRVGLGGLTAASTRGLEKERPRESCVLQSGRHLLTRHIAR